MAKQVVWSLRAQDDRKAILKYWKKHNKSSTYSKKLNQLFKIAIKLIIDHPKIGKPTDQENVRIKIIRDYLMVYEETDLQIQILAILNSREDPGKLERILK